MMKSLFTIIILFTLQISFAQDWVNLDIQMPNKWRSNELEYEFFKGDSLIGSGTVTKVIGGGMYFHYDIGQGHMPPGEYTVVIKEEGEEVFRYTKIEPGHEYYIDVTEKSGNEDPHDWWNWEPNVEMELYNRVSFPSNKRATFKHQIGIVQDYFFSIDSKRNFLLGGYYTYGLDNTFFNCDTLMLENVRPTLERLTSIYLEGGLIFRLALKKNRYFQTKAFWDIGINYRAPGLLRFNTYNGRTKVRNGYLKEYRWNDWSVVSKLGKYPLALTFEYRLSKQLIHDLPMVPRMSYGISLVLNGAEWAN